MFSLSKKNTPSQVQQNLQSLSWFTKTLMMLVVLVCFATLSPELSPWFVGFNSLLIINFYRCIHVKVKPSKSFVFILALIGALMLALLGRQLGLMLTMVNMLVFTHVMKLYEQNHPRDFYIFNLLSLMVIATTMIFHQSIWFFVYFLTVLILSLLPLLFYFGEPSVSNKPFDKKAWVRVKTNGFLTGKVLLFSIPLAVFMFFIFPRLQPFSTVPLAKSAKTGLSDQVNVGDISSLVQSNELAFRVDFESNQTPPSPMYWRGLVMEYFDGSQWQSADNNPSFKAFFVSKKSYSDYLDNLEQDDQLLGPSIRYQVYQQPSFQPWLFALDVANPVSPKIAKLADNTLVANRPVTQKMVYQVESYPQAKMSTELSSLSRAINLALPEASNPRLRELAKQLKASVNSQKDGELAIINSVLTNFREQEYFYTLTPPTLTGDRLDQFYFQTHQGFCVHYASTFTFIMRAAGIPSRLVTGYLGGKYHQQGQFYSVYQKDAHAWSEVWLEGKGWTRIDPTSAVSPERITLGIDAALSEEQALLEQGFLSTAGLLNFPLLLKFQLTLDLIDYQWTRYIVGFDSQKQSRLLQQLLGKEQAWKTALFIAGALMLVFLLFFLLSYRGKGKEKIAEEQKLFNALVLMLKQKKVVKNAPQASNTVRQFCLGLSKQFPNQGGLYIEFYQVYERMRYQSLSKQQYQQKKAQLKQCLKALTEQTVNEH